MKTYIAASAGLRLWLATCTVTLVISAVAAEVLLPGDGRNASCVSSSPDEIGGWFSTESGIPPGSVTVPDNSNLDLNDSCSFFKAAAHMFLWLTSSAPAEYGGGSHVFNSSVFYEVSGPNDARRRTLRQIPRGPDQVAYAREHPLDLKVVQKRPGTPASIADIAGKFHAVRIPKWVQQESGALSSIFRTQIEKDGQVIFFDLKGAPIARMTDPNEKQTILDQDRRPIVIAGETAAANGRRYPTDGNGDFIEYEEGQADQEESVLMAQSTGQTNPLVYYGIRVNDVYAYFHKAAASDQSIDKFPTNDSALTALLSRRLPDVKALAVELKMAWIDTDGLAPAEVARYVTIPARIQAYKQADPTNQTWIPNGYRDTTLGLVGMHVVFSAKDHPQMLWATFEHVKNTPSAVKYEYWDSAGNEHDHEDKLGPWLFSSALICDDATKNQRRMSFGNESIVAATNNEIGPSDVCRMNPWGDAEGKKDDNTDIIGINRRMRDVLPTDDPRKNYILVGVTWTPNGELPSEYNVGSGTNHRGTPRLANTAMETFVQERVIFRNGTARPSNCLACHRHDTRTLKLSHIWSEIEDLP